MIPREGHLGHCQFFAFIGSAHLDILGRKSFFADEQHTPESVIAAIFTDANSVVFGLCTPSE